MKKVKLILAMLCLTGAALAQCPNFQISISGSGAQTILTNKGDNVQTSYTYCPTDGPFMLGASGAPYNSHPTYTWTGTPVENGKVIYHAIWKGLQGLTDNLTLQPGVNNITVRTWVCADGAGSCGCEQRLYIYVCTNTVGLEEESQSQTSRLMRTEYTDLLGRVISPEPGTLYLKKQYFENGTIKTTKNILFIQ